MIAGYILFALLLIAVIGVAIYLFRDTRRLKGLPTPTSVDCVNYVVEGHMVPDTSEQPTEFYAYIFDVDTTDPTGIPESQWRTWPCNHTWTGDVDFRLTNVHGDASLVGSVRVAVWCVFSDMTTMGPGHGAFTCGGSGSGSVELLARRSGAVTSQQVADTAPLQCTIDVTGFGPSILTAFNRVWKLAHCGCGHRLLWDNGGDGSETPRVELATERPFGTPWILTFRLGEVMISYTKSAEEWRALAANTFHSVTANGVSDDAILPASVTVVPA